MCIVSLSTYRAYFLTTDVDMTRKAQDKHSLINLGKVLRIAWDFISDFADDLDRKHLFLLAAGVAFNLLWCLIPFVIIAISVAGWILDESTTKSAVAAFLSQFAPDTPMAQSAVDSVLAELTAVFSYSSLAGWIAGGVLLWTSSALFSAMRTGLNAIFRIPTPRVFIVYKVKDIALIIVTLLVMLASSILGTLGSSLAVFSNTGLPPDTEAWINGTTVWLLSIIGVFFLFSVLYFVIPNARMSLRTVAIAGLTAALLWEITRYAFSFYISQANTMGRFYGGYAVFTATALWVYTTCLVFLLSAQLTHFIEQRFAK